MRTSILFIALLMCVAIARGSDVLPAKPQAAPILLTGADVYTVAGEVQKQIEKA